MRSGIITSMDKIKWWKNRKIDWEKQYFTPSHPHRSLIIKELLRFKFQSVFEIGCGSGANLYDIYHIFKRLGVEVGGTDINEDAINEAKKQLPFDKDLCVGDARDIFFSDKSLDIILSDACLMYVPSKDIDKTIKGIKRVSRNGVILCEIYTPSIWKRLYLWWKEGYWTHNYPKLLKKYGFFDIKITKITNWGDSLWDNYGYIISGKI